MSDTNTPLVGRHPQTTVLASLTAILETAAIHIKDVDYRQIAAPMAPFLALLVTLMLKHLLKNYKCRKSIAMLNGWIKSLDEELNNPNVTTGRKKEVTKEIAKYKSELKQFEKDYIVIRVE